MVLVVWVQLLVVLVVVGAAAASGKAEADSPKNNEGDAVDAVVVVRDVDPAEESV